MEVGGREFDCIQNPKLIYFGCILDKRLSGELFAKVTGKINNKIKCLYCKKHPYLFIRHAMECFDSASLLIACSAGYANRT